LLATYDLGILRSCQGRPRLCYSAAARTSSARNPFVESLE